MTIRLRMEAPLLSSSTVGSTHQPKISTKER